MIIISVYRDLKRVIRSKNEILLGEDVTSFFLDSRCKNIHNRNILGNTFRAL